MSLARRRMRRAAVIGPAPVVRTATTVATAAMVAHGVNRRWTGDKTGAESRTGPTPTVPRDAAKRIVNPIAPQANSAVCRWVGSAA